MKKSFGQIVIALLFFNSVIFSAQKIENYKNFTELVREESGDLNGDGKKDKVVVLMDTVDKRLPLLLQIFLSESSGKLNLKMSSTQIIEPQYPLEKNGEFNGFQIPNFFIEDGNLKMFSEIKGGTMVNEFKYQNGNFELIKVSKGIWDGVNTTTETEFNLLTGSKIEIIKYLGSEKIMKENKEMIIIKPLPKLQDFKYSDREKY